MPPEPELKGISEVSSNSMSTSSTGTDSSCATICRSTVWEPVPVSQKAMCSVGRPDEFMLIFAANRPTPCDRSVMASPCPVSIPVGAGFKPAPTLRAGRLPANGIGGAAQRLLGADVLPDVAYGRGVAVAQQVHLPELVGVNAHLAGDEVCVRFDGEDHLRLGRASHVALGDVVGVDHVAVNAGVRYAVDAAQVVGAPQVHRRLERAIAPAVEHHPRLSRHQRPVALHPAADGHRRRVARVGGHQLLDVVHHHLDRTPGVQRQVVAEGHVHERTLAAEVAADAARVQHDALLVHSPHCGQLLAQGVGVLVVNPDLHKGPFDTLRASGLGADDAGVGFDVGLVHQLGVEGVLEH